MGVSKMFQEYETDIAKNCEDIGAWKYMMRTSH